MKYIPNIIGMQTKTVKLARYAKKPTSLTSIHSSVLAIIHPEKVTCNHNVISITAFKHDSRKECATIM